MLTVLDVFRQNGWAHNVRTRTQKRGLEYQGPCPWCGDGGKGRSSDRFHVLPEWGDKGGSYWCRQCGKSGDVIQALRDLEGRSFKEACELAQIDPPRQVPMKTPAPKQQASEDIPWHPEPAPEPPEQWQHKAQKMIQWAFENLMRNDPVKGWLAERGISEVGIKLFRLGWCPADIFRPRENWGLPTEKKSDGQKKRLWIPQGLVIPYRMKGQYVRIRVRRPRGEPRYYVVPGSSSATFVRGLKQRAFVVVESELDAMLLEQQAIDMAGAVALGSANAKPDKGLYEVLKSCARILVSLDYDSAGTKYTEWWLKEFPQAKDWPPPTGKDLGEAYKAGVDIRAWVAAGLPEAWTIAV
ncbi:MAG: toprim domain-containing protein [Deltaproteobacteria bacterium]|nr:toprim domain-containing protein [Deltaproteobacteria bacterium]MBW2124207.1 toprim domain-containing protein [Deltaproteobacteria bacterium]